MMSKKEINVAVIGGAGNIGCSLVQALEYYKDVKGEDPPVNGIMHNDICGYTVSSIKIRVVIDVDARKVGKPLNKAIFAKPNCTKVFCKDIPDTGVIVKMGYVEDGVSQYMLDYPDKDKTFVLSEERPIDVREELIKNKIDVVAILLPTGSQKAVERYIDDIVAARCGLVNFIPVFVASDEKLADIFREAKLPVVGDDGKSLLGSTVIHRVIAWLINMRGMKIIHSKQLNCGGNTDFLNLMDILRRAFKKISKTESVLAMLSNALGYNDLVIEPAFYVPYQNDNKQADISFNVNQLGEIPMTLDMHLSVEDSPGAVSILLEAIRACMVAKDRGLSGPIVPVCAHLMKHPPVQMEEGAAREELEKFIVDSSRNIWISPSRLKRDSQSGEYWSEYWTDETEDAIQEAKKRGVHFEVWGPETGYHPNDEVVQSIEKAGEYLMTFGKGYEKNLFVPFGATREEHKERIIRALSRFPEINVWATNTQPDREYLERIPNIRGLIGVDDFALGQKLFDDLISASSVSRVAVFVHEENKALQRRIDGIKDRAKEAEVEVLVCENQEQLKKAFIGGKTGGIGLGIRGTQEFMRLEVPNDLIVPITSVDATKVVLDAMAKTGSNKKIIAVYTQIGLGKNSLCGHTNIINPVRVTA
jgi:myo-inositol-1-phosphate synthase